MRNLVLLLMFAVVAIPAPAARRVTVDQLDQALAKVKSKPDQEVVRWLSGLQLTERMSTPNLMRWKDAMPGVQSWKALTALADSSAFLGLPSEDIPHTAPLDQDAQRQLLALATAYVENTLSKLPDFFATQAINMFEDTPLGHEDATPYQPLHYADYMSATVFYRGGKEVMETHSGEVAEKDQTVTPTAGLLSSGEFGPVLNTVLTDAQKGELTWDHWEAGAASPVAVFRYSVPRSRSHYKVKVLVPDRGYPFQARPGYHGEIAIDPASGTILRLTLVADLIDDDPMSRADLMVEYGPVEIGGRTYVCPVKSVALTVASQDLQTVELHGFISHARGPSQTLLNDVTFEHYHVLRSDVKILTGADTDDDKDLP